MADDQTPAEDTQNVEEILACKEEYEKQLRGLEDYLVVNPDDEESQQMKEVLTELLAMTRDILEERMKTADREVENMLEATPAVEEQPCQGSFNSEEMEAKDKGGVSHADEQQGLRKRKFPDVSSALPQNSRKMHPKNKYSEVEPDFWQLAEAFPSLRPFVHGHRGEGKRAKFQWTSFEGTRELTRALLLQDFGINWWLPDGHLCPPVPNRLNYIHWIDDLLAISRPSWEEEGSTEAMAAIVRGVDIGTGASCIYPLLGASVYGWSFLATDITDAAMEGAQKNLERNPHLAPKIELRRSLKAPTPEDRLTGGGDGDPTDLPVLLGALNPSERFHFCMCNPPFFESLEEAGANPRTACGGTETEMVYRGGEEAFVGRIVEDSLALRDRVHWYSTMVGKKKSLRKLSATLRQNKVPVVRTFEFVQGRTSRWGLAWSFSVPPAQAVLSLSATDRLSFTLQGLGRGTTAWNVLQTLADETRALGASVAVDVALFSLKEPLRSFWSSA